jgi:hypothetical protein
MHEPHVIDEEAGVPRVLVNHSQKKSSGKNLSSTFLDTTQTALKTCPTILLLRVYLLQR